VLDLRVLRFAVIVCLACSVLVSAAAVGLRDRQEANKAFDMRKNILKSVDLLPETPTPEAVNRLFDERMRGLVLDPSGQIVEGRTPDSVDPDAEPDLLPLYERLDADGDIEAYTLPISGKGLWSTIYGYFALEPDLNTVRGITFYQHGETPGLGGEIEKPWFTQNFVGKKILGPDGEVESVTVVKGKAADKHPEDRDHYVDGISGATITGQGVSDFLKADLLRYEPYFSRIRAASPEETT
jgi:Na+-transporting NADH:ubiquinone oxidoreductase subunit C